MTAQIASLRIIDTHMHLGRSSISGVENRVEDLLSSMEENGVSMGLILPQASQFTDVFSVHEKIREAALTYPERFRGVMCVNPRLGDELYFAEADKCFREFGFLAIKLDPNIHAVPIESFFSERVFCAAEKYGVPVIIHTGSGVYSNPVFAIPMAKRFPDVKIVLAHAGMLTYASEATLAARLCDNIFLECSWSATMHLQKMIREIGTHKMMFGSDHISNLPVELAKLRALRLNASQTDDIAFRTAEEVFQLKSKGE